MAIEEARVLAADPAAPPANGEGDNWLGCTVRVLDDCQCEIFKILVGEPPPGVSDDDQR